MAGPGCRPVAANVVLPDVLAESSGVAVSLDHPGTFWTHNDAGAQLFAVDQAGAIRGTFTLDAPLRDWEDIAVSMCPDGGSCLYLADVGDNYEERTAGTTSIRRLREPDPSAGGALDTERFPVRLPDGPRDIEAMFVLPGERVYLVTKGRNHPITVYRYPGPLRADTVTLQVVQHLSERARILPRLVTGASASPRGGVVAIRTYEALQFYRFVGDTLAPIDNGLVNLRSMEEAQGEGVALGLGGMVVLTSEDGPVSGDATMNFLSCSIEAMS